MRDYSKFSADSFAKDLLEVDWDRMIANGANCSDKLFSTFYNKYNKIVNKHAPFKRLSNRKAKQLSKPWITTGIKASIAVKNKLYASGDNSRYKCILFLINSDVNWMPCSVSPGYDYSRQLVFLFLFLKFHCKL